MLHETITIQLILFSHFTLKILSFLFLANTNSHTFIQRAFTFYTEIWKIIEIKGNFEEKRVCLIRGRSENVHFLDGCTLAGEDYFLEGG